MEPEIKTGREREKPGNKPLTANTTFGPHPSGMASMFALLVHFSMSSGAHKPFSPLGKSVRSNRFGGALLNSRSPPFIFKKMHYPKQNFDEGHFLIKSPAF